MDKKKLINLIKKQENTKLDFKQTLDLAIESGRKELAKDISAIANSRGGRGYIVIGVEDKSKRLVGIEEGNSFTEEQIQQIISSRCEPPIPISFEILDIDKKKIGVITIYDSNQKPYQLRENGAFYIRRGSTTDTMRKEELISAFEESMSFNVELCPMIKSNIEALNLDLIYKYFRRKGIDAKKDNILSLMESASIINKDKETGEFKATLGGLLVFSEVNSIYIPHNMIRVVNKINSKFEEVTIIQGNLISMIDESEEVIRSILPQEYPCNAIIEGIKNAVLYRDYGDFYEEIEITLSYNSTVITSPGSLIKEVRGRENSNYSKRNMWIYEKLITLDDKKRFLQSGRGFGRMKKAFKGKGKVQFINSTYTNIFKVVYPGVNAFK